MAESPFTEVGSALFGKIFSSIIYVGIGAIIIAVLGGIMYYLIYYRRKFDIMVKIRSQRAGDPSIFFDKAAILYDRKSKNKYFRLLETKVDLPVPPFTVMQKTNKGDYLELWRKSEEEFSYLTPPSIDKNNVIRADGKLYPLTKTEQKQIEGDIYWYTTRRENLKKLFDPESLLMKILPWVPHIIGGFILIFVLWVLMDKLPAILSELTDLTKELRTLKGADIITHG